MIIYCCECKADIEARLTDGAEVYPHRADLRALPFWRCDSCLNFVGCHHKTANRTQPLGCIPNDKIKRMRTEIHAVIDPLWKKKKISRGQLYKRLSESFGRQYHTAEIRSLVEGHRILAAAKLIREELASGALSEN